MYKYVLLFTNPEGGTFVTTTKTNWLDTAGFAALLREGHDKGGTFVKSWRSFIRKGRK